MPRGKLKQTKLPGMERNSKTKFMPRQLDPSQNLPVKRLRFSSPSSIEGGDDTAQPEQDPTSAKRRRGADASLPVVIDDDSDDMPLAPSSSAHRGRRRPHISDDDDSDGDVITSVKRRRLMSRKAPISPPASTPATTKQSASTIKKPRTEKEKRRELLRRRRLGEKLDEEDLESSYDEERKGLYDSDGDNVALDEFFDDEDEAQPSTPVRRKEKGRNKDKNQLMKHVRKPSPARSQDDDDDDLDGFVVDDEDIPMGVPAELLRQEIPLEFTLNAHKRLKDHFKDALEWLVQRRINPQFERNDPMYVQAWRKLDDEVKGLANSKFVSSGWKPEFHKALRARPFFLNEEIPRGDPNRYATCHACGRSNHPASWKIILSGTPYYAETLEDVDSETDGSSDEDDNGSNQERSKDAAGNSIEPASREWFVGVVCNSNAETAHNLIHWRHALLEWVEGKLDEEGQLTDEKAAQRDKMKAKKRRDIGLQIVDKWEAEGIVRALFSDFSKNLEQAREKSTTGPKRGGRFIM